MSGCFSHIYVCVPHAYSTQGGPRWASDSLELQTVVSHHTGVGNGTSILWESSEDSEAPAHLSGSRSFFSHWYFSQPVTDLSSLALLLTRIPRKQLCLLKPESIFKQIIVFLAHPWASFLPCLSIDGHRVWLQEALGAQYKTTLFLISLQVSF